jgi:MFS superfamily sulfate permease-like transporter
VSPAPTRTPSSAAGGIAADVLAGFLVFLVALPLSLGIAMASGVPPVAGVLTAAVGGLLPPLLGQAPLTIKGPAAGLIVIVLAAVQDLGAGDPALGYRRVLAVALVASLVQIAFALLGLARFGAMVPPSVVHGMLAAIGVTIFAKQVHLVMGVLPHGREPLHLLLEVPSSLAHGNPEPFVIGGVSLALMLVWPRLGAAARRAQLRIPLDAVPAPLVALSVAIGLSSMWRFAEPHDVVLFGVASHVGPELLLSLPPSLAAAITLPDLSVLAEPRAYMHVLALALVGSLESVLSVHATDALDPRRQRSDVRRDLASVGVANLATAAIGGIPMISEIVRSKTNLDAGATSSRANFAHGVFLLGFVALVPGLLQQIPLAALAAMLVVTGMRLASPGQLRHARELGWDQLASFVVTLVVTLAVDLLVGLAAGVAVELAHDAWRSRGVKPLWSVRLRAVQSADASSGSPGAPPEAGTVAHLVVEGAATFMALARVEDALDAARRAGARTIRIDVTQSPVVDHTFLSAIQRIADEWPDVTLEWVGLAELHTVSPAPTACHYAPRAASGGAR